MVWLAGGLLLLTAIVTGVMLLFQRESEPEQQMPAETTQSSETTADSISSTEETTETTAAESTSARTETAQTTAAATVPETEAIPVESITLTFYEAELYIGETCMPIVTMLPENAADKSEIWQSYDSSVASVSSSGRITAHAAGWCIVRVTSGCNPEVFAEISITVHEPPATEPLTESPVTEVPAPASPSEPTYIGGILIANKTYALPKDYNPGLDPTCKAQFDLLSQAAAAEGLNIWLASGFRSYDSQAAIYNNYLNWYGQEKTDTLSARPGHSEHQTGLAIDVNSITDSFANTPEAAWLAEHAHEFGFIIRYPKGKEHITGYKYEPWHIRYLGVETAAAVYNSGLTLEEYLGITSCYAE